MKENPIVEKSFVFAVRIVRLYKYLCEEKKEFTLSKQLLRAGTSVGANISEAQRGQSKKDFAAKMNIASKECAETMYWLRLLGATDYLNEKECKSMTSDCVELEKMLVSIVKSSTECL